MKFCEKANDVPNIVTVIIFIWNFHEDPTIRFNKQTILVIRIWLIDKMELKVSLVQRLASRLIL